jgi:hypothetical protein
VAALAWANIDPAGYAATWHTVLLIRSGTVGVAWSAFTSGGGFTGAILGGGWAARAAMKAHTPHRECLHAAE